MRVAIDQKCINKIKDLNQFEYMYVFDDSEDYRDLIKLGLHCVHKSVVNDIDINLSHYKLNAFKTANIDEPDWYKMPPKKNYKFAIIIPNYNNDHRKL